jgi:tRNA modification GTPase
VGIVTAEGSESSRASATGKRGRGFRFSLFPRAGGGFPAHMQLPTEDDGTIVALATPPGTAALAVVRVSGPLARTFAAGSLFGRPLPPRRAVHLNYRAHDGTRLDDVVAVAYEAPASYTGEDALEISCHGSPYLVQRLIADLTARGCRPAEPGEFTRRAFMGGRLDLSQAEAVMDLIRARSDRALAVANQQLKGELGRHLRPLENSLLDALAQVEAYIDFPDEDLPPEDRERVADAVASVLRGVGGLLATRHYGAVVREGLNTVLLGAPNAGKSSLLNRLLGYERALVSPTPGTTRDFLEEPLRVGPHLLRLVDTAGLDTATEDEIERRGVERSLERAREADLVLRVVDVNRPVPPLPRSLATELQSEAILLIFNKIDLSSDKIDTVERARLLTAEERSPGVRESVAVSCVTGEGFDDLVAAIIRAAERFQGDVGGDLIAINARHAFALERVERALRSALTHLALAPPAAGSPHNLRAPLAPELLASDLREALEALGEIAGRYDPERMLDQLFRTFCIGK